MTTRNLTIATLTLTLAALAFIVPAPAQSADEPAFECTADPIDARAASGMKFSLRTLLLRKLGVTNAHRLPPAVQVRELMELLGDGDSVASVLGCEPPSSGGGRFFNEQRVK